MSACRRAPMHNRIVVIPRFSSDARWLSEHVGIGEATARAKLNVYWNGPSDEANLQEQTELAERAIQGNAYGIIIEPSTSFTMNRAIREALAHSIPVVVLGEPIDITPSPRLSFVLSDISEAGRLIASRLDAILHGHGEIAIFGLAPQTPGNVERSDAIEAALQQNAPEIHVVEKMVGSFSIGSSELVAERVIQEHPELKAIVALTPREGYSAAAAVHALHVEDRVRIIACDQTLEVLMLLRQGAIDAILIQNMRGMGSAAVDNIIAEHHHRPVSSPVYFKPSLITRQNIGDERIQQLLLMHRSQP
ncbi:sugar ABC transporter substrate-binding protein [Edaphobacter dinghuensis]|nr:substrate-binding domain-containing protein [Edaphobacter dinghuensis]